MLPFASSRMPPQFTIITPSLDQIAFLPAALASVRSQQDVDAEHIVVDGGASDGSGP